jgi:hypothetical protein
VLDLSRLEHIEDFSQYFRKYIAASNWSEAQITCRCSMVMCMPVLCIMKLKPEADILKRMCLEELGMRGLVPQLANYDIYHTARMSAAEIAEIMSGQHEWSATLQVSDILRVDRDSGSRIYYRDTNGYVELELEFEVFQIDLKPGEMLTLKVSPGEKPSPCAIRCDIEDMRSVVGGDAEINPLCEGVIIVTNKDAQYPDAKTNRTVNGTAIAGTFLICGVDKDRIPCSLTEEQFGSFYVQFKLCGS